MPQRKTPLVIGEYYHTFNRSMHKEPIFSRRSDCKRAIDTLQYYQYSNPPKKLSYFLASGFDKRQEILHSLEQNQKLVEIICYCLMPNHYHFLLKQVRDNGISQFIALFQNSYTRFINTKYDRDGHLYRGQFKAVRIEDDEQLIHVTRYIHLNPYSSFVVKTLNDLFKYEYSSLPEYLGSNKGFCEQRETMSLFSSIAAYKKFLTDQADYQRSLKNLEHLTFE